MPIHSCFISFGTSLVSDRSGAFELAGVLIIVAMLGSMRKMKYIDTVFTGLSNRGLCYSFNCDVLMPFVHVQSKGSQKYKYSAYSKVQCI